MEYKTVWLSDLHLGARGCNARGLLDFLRRTECRTLYLVGDVVDLWSLKRVRYWPQGDNVRYRHVYRADFSNHVSALTASSIGRNGFANKSSPPLRPAC